MGIQIIPSPGDQIGGIVKDLAGSLDKYLNPNKDLQISMQRAMASNPELIQHMADLETNNPGTMARLGLGPIADIVSGVQQSAAGQGEAATRPGAARQATSQQAAATSTADLTVNKNQLTGDVVQKAAKIMSADPSISFDTALKTLTGETGQERASAGRKGKVEEAALSPQLKALQRAGQIPEDLSKIDWATEARSFIDGNLDGGRAAAYLNPANPDISRAFNEALDAEKQRRQLEASQTIAALHGDKSIDNFQVQKAFQEYQKAGGVGTLNAWRGLLFDPAQQNRARELMKDPAKATTPEDKDLLATANVTKQQIDLDKLRDITLVNSNINSQLKTIDKADTDEERDASIAGLNQLLQARGTLGGMQVKAVWAKKPWYTSDKLEFQTKDGKTIPDEKVKAQLADPYATDITTTAQLTPASKAALDLVLGTKDKGAALGKLKMQDTSPGKTVSAQVEAELMRQGVLKRVGATP